MGEFLERLATRVQSVLPQHLLTAMVYRLMRIEWTWLKNFQIRLISTIAGVNWSEAASCNYDDYPHFNAFFTRELKPGARPIDDQADVLVSPCDGHISESGPIEGERIFQAKGQRYSLAALLGGDPAAAQLEDGYFFTIYLSPRDYHRVHMPLEGNLQRMIHVPGKLFSVAPYTVRQVPDLFARNERVISIFDSPIGPFAQVLVGAMLVGSMETVWAGQVTPSNSRSIRSLDYAEQKLKLARGQEMGRFNMGSTVILILPHGVIRDSLGWQPGAALRMGQALAHLNQ